MNSQQRVDEYLEGCELDEDLHGFRHWLRELDTECLNRFDVSVFDLEGVLWREHFDSGLDPGDALDYEREAGSFTGLDDDEEYDDDD